MDGIVGKVNINALLLQTVCITNGPCSNGRCNLQNKEVCINISDVSSEDSGQYFGNLVA